MTAGYDQQNYTLLIFNRWGDILFESHNAAVDWDGSYHNKVVPDGTYVWKIILKTSMNAESKMFVGHINVLR